MSADRDFQQRIRDFLEEQDGLDLRAASDMSKCMEEAKGWIRDTARPAFQELARVFSQGDRELSIFPQPKATRRTRSRVGSRTPQTEALDYSVVEVNVSKGNGPIEFRYLLRVDCTQPGSQIKKSITNLDDPSPRAELIEAVFRPIVEKTVGQVTQREVAEDFFEDYQAAIVRLRR